MLSKAQLKAMAQLGRKKFRREQGELLVEGVVQVRALLRLSKGVGRFEAHTVVIGEDVVDDPGVAEVRELAQRCGVMVEIVPAQELRKLSSTDTPQGILAIAKPGPVPTVAEIMNSLRAGCVLVLDGIQDPGNVGTLIRAAAAFGIHGVLLTHGCADPANPKALRASMGGYFALPVCPAVARQHLAEILRGANIPVLIAQRGGENFVTATWPPTFALVLGAEVAGVSAELRAVATRHIGINQAPFVEPQSLNAAMAGSVLMATWFARHTP